MSEAGIESNSEAQMAGRASALKSFCTAYGFNTADLAEPDANTPQYTIHGAAADGRVQALLVMQWGRYGNYVFQVLHAVMLARKIGCKAVALTPVPGGPAASSRRIRGILFTNPRLTPPCLPALSGHFFKARAFPGILQKIAGDFLHETVRDYLKPVFADIRRRQRPLGPKAAVAHFRAGDIFSETPPHPFYVQPPVSFYIAAISHLRAAHGVTKVRLVAEGRGNPAVAGVEEALRGQGVAFETQTGSFEEDFGTLLGATHLIASFSTFVEAAAMLSDHLKTYAAFRDVDSHVRFQQREKPLLDMLFYEAGVECMVYEDAAGGYIPHRGWDNSPAQIDMMLNYPAANLRPVKLPAKPRRRRWFWK